MNINNVYITKREIRVMALRHHEKMTYEKIGREMLITTERARQIDSKVISKLNDLLTYFQLKIIDEKPVNLYIVKKEDE